MAHPTGSRRDGRGIWFTGMLPCLTVSHWSNFAVTN